MFDASQCDGNGRCALVHQALMGLVERVRRGVRLHVRGAKPQSWHYVNSRGLCEETVLGTVEARRARTKKKIIP